MADEIDDGIISFKWNNHSSTFFNVLSTLRIKETYTDATLACEGKFYPIHKLVLSTCSDYFLDIFERTNCRSPVIILKDVRPNDLEALLDYMYYGEVDVRQNDLSELLKTAECLRVKGLAAPDDDFNLKSPNKVSPLSREFKSKSTSTECNTPASNILSNVQSNESNFKTPANKSVPENVNQSFPSTKRFRRDNKILNSSEVESKPTLLSNEDVSKPPNAIEVPLQFHSPLSPLPISSVTSNLPVTPLKPKHSKENQSLAKCRLIKNQKQIRIKSKPIKIVRSRNKDKDGIKLQTAVSSDLKASNQKVFYVNHDDHNTSAEEDTRKGNLGEDALPQEVNSDPPTPQVDNISNEKLEQPGTSSNSFPKKKGGKPMANVLGVEQYCKVIGLPKFSAVLSPYLEGHQLDKRSQIFLTKRLIEELMNHFMYHSLFDVLSTAHLRSNFYTELQMKLISKYPNIINEESNSKRGKKGPLSSLINKLVATVNCKLRTLKQLASSREAEEAGEHRLSVKSPDTKNDELDDDDNSFEQENREMEYKLENNDSVKIKEESPP